MIYIYDLNITLYSDLGLYIQNFYFIFIFDIIISYLAPYISSYIIIVIISIKCVSFGLIFE